MPRKPKSRQQARGGGLPSKQEVLDYLRSAPAKAGKREIALAFGIKGGDRIALKSLLSEMAKARPVVAPLPFTITFALGDVVSMPTFRVAA